MASPHILSATVTTGPVGWFALHCEYRKEADRSPLLPNYTKDDANYIWENYAMPKNYHHS